MTNRLQRMVLYPFIVGSLLIPQGCKEKEIDKTADKITGVENSYDKALKLAQNPYSYATGNSIVEKKDLGFYFLDEKEMEYLKYTPSTEMRQLNLSNPFIMNEEELKRRTLEAGNSIEKDILEAGGANYKMWGLQRRDKKIDLHVFRFRNKDGLQKSFEKLENYLGLDKDNILFRGDYTLTCIDLSSGWKNRTSWSKNQTIAMIDILFNYQHRTGMEMIQDTDPKKNERVIQWMKEFKFTYE